MATDELEKYLEAGAESQRLDFKQSCPWDVNKYAKDILAMSNVQDGGIIIIGVIEKPDNSYERQGIDISHKSTYKKDQMMDQMASFADPHVDFNFEITKDNAGLEYGIITVNPFIEIPVICRKQSSDTQVGVVYYRNRNGRPQSAKVSSPYDMRDILNRAAVKLMQQYRAVGLSVTSSAEEQLKNELGDL